MSEENKPTPVTWLSEYFCKGCDRKHELPEGGYDECPICGSKEIKEEGANHEPE